MLRSSRIRTDVTTRVTFYDNGSYVSRTIADIQSRIASAGQISSNQLPSGWEQSPVTAARYFTMNLLGLSSAESGSVVTGKNSEVVLRPSGRWYGRYRGDPPFSPIQYSSQVTLETLDGHTAIDLVRGWRGGPWLVTHVGEFEPN